MGKRISLYLSDSEMEYLEGICLQEGFKNQHKEPRVSQAIKQLIRERETGKTTDLGNLEMMIEQIHAMIPQLAYRSILSILIDAKDLPDNAVKELQTMAVKQSTNLCGDFQKATYKNLYVKFDHKNMCALPIEEKANRWALKHKEI